MASLGWSLVDTNFTFKHIKMQIWYSTNTLTVTSSSVAQQMVYKRQLVVTRWKYWGCISFDVAVNTWNSLKIDRTILQGTSPQLEWFLECSLLGDGETVRRESCLSAMTSLHWRHNDHDGVSNHQPRGYLLNRLFRRRSKKTSKLRVTSLCAGN